ncbi:MAG TPA: HEAT repeat domain-containing protein [Planctomycetota bacterium]|nr:HEAT repeat domain-containing protein [Planctomycetota bacterium]
MRIMLALAATAALWRVEVQDDKAWAEAMAYFQTNAVSRDPVDRRQAVEEISRAFSEKREKQLLPFLVGLLRNEFAREGPSGRSEEKVSGDVLESLQRLLRKFSAKESIAEMTKLAKQPKESVRVRAQLLWALAEKGDLKDLIELVDDKNPILQIAAIDSVVEKADPSSVALFLRVLSEPRTWEVKWAALLGIEKKADDSVIEPLIDSLARSRVDEGRLKDLYVRILRKLLASEMDTDDANAWKAAWQAKKSGTESAPGSTVADMTQFYGLKTRSTRLVFVLDKTGSMTDPGSEPDRPAYKLPTEATGGEKEPAPDKLTREECAKIVKRWAGLTARTRIDVAKKELINTLFVLSPKVHFNVIWFEATPTPWKQELVPATWANKLEAIQATDKVVASGGTNIWDALELGFKMIEAAQTKTGPNPVVLDKKVNYATATNGVDTMFLMSDGRPTVGRIATTDDVISELKKVNRLRKVTIHTICVGDVIAGTAILDRPDPAFLKRVADQNNGDFAHIRK